MVWESPSIPWDDCSAKRQGDLCYAWHYGDLRYKLDPHQLAAYDKLMDALQAVSTAAKRRYILQWARQTGKDWLLTCISISTAIRHPGKSIRYGAPTQDMIREIVQPNFEEFLADCPPMYRPKLNKSEHKYEFPNGSVICLVGCDMYPERMRGPHSILVLLTEAGFFKNLTNVVESILPQLLTHQEVAFQIFASTPPISPLSHDFTIKYKVQAETDGLYNHSTIWDNPRITKETVEGFIEEFGGYESVATRRELLAEDVADASRLIVPEIIDVLGNIYIKEYKLPSHALCFTVIDPGSADLFAVIYGFYNFMRDEIVIQKCWAKNDPTTSEVAQEIVTTERELWKDFFYWQNQRLNPNPYKRYSDTDLRLIKDLRVEYGINVQKTQKDNLDLAVKSLRTRVQAEKFYILEAAKDVKIHLQNGIWEENRKKFKRMKNHHWDYIACCVYFNRNVEQQINPFPPKKQEDDKLYTVWQPEESEFSPLITERNEYGDIL